MIKRLLFLCLILPCLAFSQLKITGRVINQRDTHPIPNASVFLSNATIGDHTKDDGTFALNSVKPGKYELVISLIGFDRYTQTITVDNSNITLPDITLYPATIGLAEVKIKPKTDPDRKRNFDWFKDEFLGKSDLAKGCKIVNPEMLDLDYDERNGVLTGSSVDFLIIENKSLGYRLKYLLKNFTLNNYDENNKSFSYSGSVFFERLAGTPQEEAQWQTARQEAYENSQLHFLRAALNNKIESEGFRVFRLAIKRNPQRPPDSLINENIRVYNALKDAKGTVNYKDSLNYWMKKSKLPATMGQKLLTEPLTKADMFKVSNRRGLFEFTSGGTDALFISYNKYHRFSSGAITHLSDKDNTYATLVSFNDPVALFDNNGSVINPRSLSYEGVWSRARVATLLPVDYEPAESNTADADSSLIKNVGARYNLYQTSHPTEKTYLHFDKPYYSAGDTIYFAAYVTGTEHKSTTLSGVLYIDLIDGVNKLRQSAQLPIVQGKAWGSFALPDSLKSGNYGVRAYTRLMQNDSLPVYVYRSLEIGSAMAPRVPEAGLTGKTNETTNAATQFFAESGSLITGVKTKVAFKAVAASGYGIDVKGTILDNENKEAGNFAATHLGMGFFYLTPVAGKTYRAKLTYANGKQEIVDLPRSTENGIGLEVTGSNTAYSFKIDCSKPYYEGNKNKLFTLIAYSGGVPLSITFKLDKPEVTVTLSKKDMKMGIARATLFSADSEPLCERLFFVQKDDLLKLNLSGNKTAYSARQKVSMQLKTNNGGEPAVGHYSVSVTDENKVAVDEATEPTIVNNLLLTSELKGYIEQPNYYFINANDKTMADLDLVMLTHGYRSFEWQQILKDNNKAAINYTAEKGLSINGTIMAKGKPVPNAKVKLFTRGGVNIVLDTTADKNGKFVFDNLSFPDSTRFILQARTAKGDKDVDVQVDKPRQEPGVSTEFRSNNQSENSALAAYTQSNKSFNEEQKRNGINQHVQILKEVTIKGKKETVIVAHSENLNGKGGADQVITAKELENLPCSRLIYCLQAKLTGIVFNNGQLFVRHLQNLDLNSQSRYDQPMAIILDGMFVDYDIFDSLNSNDIEGIEVLTGPHFAAIYGSQAAGGALMITTKRGRKINNYYKEAPGVIVYTAKGFYKAREFYSPQYDNPHTNQKMADLRSTIYWNPNIINDKDGKASFEYFNADGKGTYRVVVEGIDADGNLGRQVFRYKVE
ncbi:carboxypeptidase regulatory-like domain-containing protein [Mucilaginibacter sp.]|uniref:carboxypeptidase regulatory-like domain-containing protein n=1 Tax=Mucilaginibacter sp. TaxID=1882438 RepID=UPI0025E5968D|nr:carboxypeptidase regulatory-like domain-containing protein [Mucilaginibacter sp.]